MARFYQPTPHQLLLDNLEGSPPPAAAYPGVTQLTLDNPQSSDLAGLAEWKQLEVLTIAGGHGQLSRLAGIEQLDQLHTLRLLNYLYIEDYERLTALPELRALHFTDDYVQDCPDPMPPLELPRLTELMSSNLSAFEWEQTPWFTHMLGQLRDYGFVYAMDEHIRGEPEDPEDAQLKPFLDQLVARSPRLERVWAVVQDDAHFETLRGWVPDRVALRRLPVEDRRFAPTLA